MEKADLQPAAPEGDEGSRLSLLDVLPQPLVSAIFLEALHLHLHQAPSAADAREVLHHRRRDPRRVLPLVSKAFQEAANEAHGLWARVQLSMLTLMAGRMPCLVRWLGMHAPAIRVLVLYGRPLPSVEVALREHVDLVAAVVQQMTGLQQLDLARPLGAAVLARLEPRRLACLRSVGVDLAGGGGSRGGGAGGGYAARRKRASEAGEVERATANLLALPALSELLVQSCLEARLLVRDPALQPLERLHFADVRDVPRSAVLAPLACLHSLTSLRFSQRDGFQLPGPLTALSRLAHLHAGVRYRDDPLRVGADLGSLRSLRALWLQHAAFDAPSVLAALPELRTLALVGAAEAYPAVLAAMAASTQLRALHLEAHAWVVEEVPTGTWQALAELGAGCLTRLELPYTRLRELPGGAYLGRLEVLNLSQNSLPGVPAALLAATSLQFLSLGQQESSSPGDSAADRAVLQGLPRLRLLVTSSGHYSASHLSVGLRSPAEAAHLDRVRAALPAGVRVTNEQAELERGAGRLQALFEVNLRQGRL